MNHINEIINICTEVLNGDMFLEESVINEILYLAIELKANS